MQKEFKSELKNAIGQARGVLEDLQRLGIGEVYCPPVDGGKVRSCQNGSQKKPAESLKEIISDLGDCRRCRLAEKRTNIVFGVGNQNAELVFVGEGPGQEEDLKGEPFVGEAGQLLDRILIAMGMQRSDVYICNVVKCRPPGNRDPGADEIAMCEPFLARQVESIRPRVIVALGRFAAQTLLQSDTPISKLRGQWHQYRNIPLMPTFHPAYLLRNPLSKREVWEDMKAVLKKLKEGQGDTG